MPIKTLGEEKGYLEGQLLIAMPTMPDPRFQHSVIFLCAHSPAGAMGLVVNKTLDSISFPDLLEQLGIEAMTPGRDIVVHFGGPVESSRGFVLHSTDYVQEATLVVNDEIGLTATMDVLRKIAEGRGPRRSMLALGYAGWGPGQLDEEIQANGWLHTEPDEELLFGNELEDKWRLAVAKMGIDPTLLSTEAGHA
jgi:putative transcriptional regulator